MGERIRASCRLGTSFLRQVVDAGECKGGVHIRPTADVRCRASCVSKTMASRDFRIGPGAEVGKRSCTCACRVQVPARRQLYRSPSGILFFSYLLRRFGSTTVLPEDLKYKNRCALLEFFCQQKEERRGGTWTSFEDLPFHHFPTARPSLSLSAPLPAQRLIA